MKPQKCWPGVAGRARFGDTAFELTIGQQELAGVSEVACAASAAQSPTERAENVLDAIRRLIPYESALLSICDEVSGRQIPLAHVGYSQSIVEHLCSQIFEEELVRFGAFGSGAATRARDIRCDPMELPTLSRVLSPAGLNEGLTICLKTSSGRYVGTLSVSTEDATAGPSDGARAAIDLLSRTLANVADAGRMNRRLADLTEPDATAVVIGLTGPVVSLPNADYVGPVAEHLLNDNLRLVAAARKLLSLGKLPIRFVWPAPTGGQWWPVKVIPCEVTSERYPRALLIVGATSETYGLTLREIEVLTLLADGLSNKSISELFVISPRTVETHVERILSKLGEHGRAAAACRATREGLLLPFVSVTSFGSSRKRVLIGPSQARDPSGRG